MQHTDFHAAVGRQSWEWLVDLAPRLDVIVEIVDIDGAALLPADPGEETAPLRMLLTTKEPALRSAMAEVAGSARRVPLTVERLHVLCCGLGAGGVLLVARRMTGQPIEESCHDLESIATWLTAAVDASLAATNVVSVEPYRILSFERILREAASRRSIRNVVGAFVEALGVWDDVRVRCYVAGAGGRLLLYGAPLTSPSTFPGELDESIAPPHQRTVRLSRAEADRLGLPREPGETLILRLLVGEVPWLLIFSGTIDDARHVRLRVWSEILREALNEVVTGATSRLVADVSRVGVSSDDRPGAAAQAALDLLTGAIGGDRGALALTMANGTQALAVGHSELLVFEERPSGHRLVVTAPDTGSVLTLVVEREEGRFTAFERDLALAGLTAAYRLLQTEIEPSTAGERRRRFEAVDLVFDQLAADTLAAGRAASVIVVSVDASAARPGLLPGWVARIRAQLRAGDFAGLLSEREIAVLLCGASADSAALVSERLQEIVTVDDTTGASLRSGIGMSTCSPESAFEGSIVGAARVLAAAPH